MQTSHHASALLLVASLVACASSPPPQPQPAPTQTITVAPAPTPEPTPAPAPAPEEVHVSHGHMTLEHQIQFDSGSDHIREDASQGPLNALVAVLRSNTQLRRVRVEGHTDERGGHGDNQSLSQRRAQAVADYLRGHGFPNVQFEAVGYGETQPLCREDTDACHERNRRVEFTVTDPPAP